MDSGDPTHTGLTESKKDQNENCERNAGNSLKENLATSAVPLYTGEEVSVCLVRVGVSGSGVSVLGLFPRSAHALGH